MPKTPRPGKRALYAEIPEGLYKALEERVRADRRSQTTLVIMALEQLLGLSPADYEPPAPSGEAGTRRPRRRKKES